jgi:hypothetical protein
LHGAEITYKKDYCPIKVFKNSNLGRKQIYKEYLNKNDLKELEDLEMVLNSLIKSTVDQKSKKGLEIVLLLISHKRKDVKACALGNLYILARDKSFKNLAINELKSMISDKNPHVRKSALNSLELYANEANTLEVIEIIMELSTKMKKNIQSMKNNIKTSVKRFKSLKVHSKLFLNSSDKLFNKIPINKAKIKLKRRITHFYNILNYLTYKHPLFSKISKLFPELDNVDILFEENFIEQRIIPYSSISKFELKQKDPLNELATIYANTILEKGHLRRLEAFLDDEDYSIRMTGVNALTNTANILISSKKKTFIESLKISLVKVYPLLKRTIST